MRTFPIPILIALAACDPSSGEPKIEISDAWARETVGAGQSTAAYMTVRNTGSGSDRLIGVGATGARSASLHSSVNEGGISKMRPLKQGIEIGAGEAVQFSPGGNHVMIEGVASPLSAPQQIRVTLRFERSGERVIAIPVRKQAIDQSHAGH